ncbi:DUF4404 family protein [Cysteiniphilum halobium]|uniref:DUF4404 family protein n=1 Tax=Cysteiniphilum halobium TaxID=2219059 RepID=UPI000E64A9D7|nr:DUF4404 family protein [Cysteiniphilum halobium]
MPQDTIAKIKEILKDTNKLNFDDTKRMSELLDQLQTELESLPESEKVQALEIATLTKKKVEMSKLQDPKESDFSDLEQAIIEYEVSHPKLTHTLRSICNLLSSIGI